MLLVHLYVCLACVTFMSFTLPLGVGGLDLDCDRGTPWTFHLTF